MQISRKNVCLTIFWQKTVLFTCPYGISYAGLMYVKCFVVSSCILNFVLLYKSYENVRCSLFEREAKVIKKNRAL